MTPVAKTRRRTHDEHVSGWCDRHDRSASECVDLAEGRAAILQVVLKARERRNAALTKALKDVRKVQRTPRGGWQGMLNRMVEIIDAALADEQSAGNAGGTK